MISIVLPVYNAQEYIHRCISSIQGQTYGNWELIIIDNGSTDKSYEICREYSREDRRIEVLHQYQNKGVSVARNLGLERIGGEFFTFIDADDWIKPDYLERLLKIQKEYHSDMIVCGYEATEKKEENSVYKAEETDYRQMVYSAKDYFENYMLKGNTHCWGVLYRAKKVEGVRFQNKLTIGEDLLYLIHAAERMDKIVVTDYEGYYYYINPKGAMLKKFTPDYMDQIFCWQQAKNELIASYPDFQERLNSILVVSALLVVGKLAELSKGEQGTYSEELQQCLNIVKEYGAKSGVRKYLPKGYPVKILIFSKAPSLYLKLYGAKKSMEKAEE